ncbi:MAG: family transposase, partial [Pseudarthrobacter sp.]|nr:family transposase [Pseudarthrobacter sp.]
ARRSNIADGSAGRTRGARHFRTSIVTAIRIGCTSYRRGAGSATVDERIPRKEVMASNRPNEHQASKSGACSVGTDNNLELRVSDHFLWQRSAALDPTCKGGARGATGWKPALNALAISFDGRINSMPNRGSAEKRTVPLRCGGTTYTPGAPDEFPSGCRENLITRRSASALHLGFGTVKLPLRLRCPGVLRSVYWMRFSGSSGQSPGCTGSGP